jgi:hypothetical protein
MRITTKAVFDIETGELLKWEGYDYEGILELCGGGPSSQQKAAATSQTNLDSQLSNAYGQQQQFAQAQQAKVNPFYTQMMNQGMPNYSQATDAAGGTNAQAFAPARAQLEKTLGQQGNALPSGFATQARTDLADQQGQAFDQSLQGAQGAQFQAKQAGAAGLMGQQSLANPTAFSGQALQGNNSIMQAPLATPSILGQVGGALGGLGTLLSGQSGILSKAISF